MTIAEIKQRLSILDVLAHYGIKVNHNKHCLCPFHEDKKPSMRVYEETNTVYCFSGNCEHGGKKIDVIDFIMYQEKLSKHQAILKAKAMTGAAETPKTRKTPMSSSKPQDLKAIFKQLEDKLQSSKAAQSYLQERNLPTENIGFNIKDTFNKMVQCLIFPLRNEQGEIVSYYGRHIKRAAHYYLTNRQGLYPSYPSREARHLIITESVIDAATLITHSSSLISKKYEVLALYGTNGLTQEHINSLSGLPDLEEIILFLDGDEAGRTATTKYARKLHKLLPKVIISKVDTPEGEDPNSLLDSHDSSVLGHLLDQRKIVFTSKKVEGQKSKVEGEQAKTTEDTAQFSPKELIRQADQTVASNHIPKSASLDAENKEYLVFTQEPLRIHILGGIGIRPIDKLRVTLKIERTDSNSPLHQLRHSLDLYYDDQVEKLMRKTAERLELGSRETRYIIAQLIQSLEELRQEWIAEQQPKKPQARVIPPERVKTAVNVMQRKDYLTSILPDLLAKTGVVGERNNSIILWNVYATRKQQDPLHVICLGASGTGKTFLQEKITDLIPEEDKVSGTAISENALYYAQDLNLKNKLFIIEDLDGANNILYALRELQTKKSISKMVTQKDSKGNMKTEIVTVHGPICLTATTTKERLYEDNSNRCLLIYLDGSKAQQEAIMQAQRKKSAGKINRKEREATKELLLDMQALYEPITIRNPYAEQLKIPDTVFKPLRTNSHYLAFIEGITFCMQFQRERQQDQETGEQYICTTIEDIELANELMKEVLLSKSDELTKACRDFYEKIKGELAKQKKSSFYKNDIREIIRINPNNLKYYLKQLNQYGYIKAIGGNRYKQGTEYEITDLEEYEKLNTTLLTALDQALLQIKASG